MKCVSKLLLLLVIFSACSSNKEKQLDKESYQEKKESLFDQEKKSPKSFLKVDGTYNKNLWGNLVYKGTIQNSATLCAYKNVRIKILYFKDGKQVTNHEEVYTETINPSSSFYIKVKYNTPKGTDSIATYIMSAETVK